MKQLHQILYPFYRACVRVLEIIVGTILALLVLDVLLGVFTRFIIGEQTRWTEEVAIYLLIWVSLLGAAVAYADNAHLGVDYFVEKLHPGVRAFAHRMIHVIVGLFAVFALVIGGTKLVVQTLQGGQVSAALGIPVGIVYAAVPISGLFFILFAFEAAIAPEGKEGEVPVELKEIE
jgi:TRAP-type C4-dicarboxylate transport system permease small subunit